MCAALIGAVLRKHARPCELVEVEADPRVFGCAVCVWLGGAGHQSQGKCEEAVHGGTLVGNPVLWFVGDAIAVADPRQRHRVLERTVSRDPHEPRPVPG